MPVCVGPEFDTDETGRLRLSLCGDPAEQAWPFPCPVGDANPLRVDPSCGLWAPPPAKVATVVAEGSTAVVNTVVPAAFTTVETAQINIPNPSPCWPATVVHLLSVDVDWFLPPGADATAAAQVDGNEFIRVTNSAPGSGTNADGNHWEYTHPIVGAPVVPAGGAQMYSYNIAVGAGAGGARWRQVRWRFVSLVFAGLA